MELDYTTRKKLGSPRSVNWSQFLSKRTGHDYSAPDMAELKARGQLNSPAEEKAILDARNSEVLIGRSAFFKADNKSKRKAAKAARKANQAAIKAAKETR